MLLVGLLGSLLGWRARWSLAKSTYRAPQAAEAPLIDGRAEEACWAKVEWRALDQCWLGEPVPAADFSGRYKVVWTSEKLFLLAEITDDVQRDTHPDPLAAWWDDDCLEIFVDPDHSGGNHQYSHQAFAYHVALDGYVVDMARDSAGHLFDKHVRYMRKGPRTVWEAAITLYPATYDERQPTAARPLPVVAGQPIGFMLAYCDNDTARTRENFYGSESISGPDRNQGWIDASEFGTLLPVRR